MNPVEALNTLISAVNIAHSKGGVYSMEETHYIYMAISFFDSLKNQTKPEAPLSTDVVDNDSSEQDSHQNY
jgi:hypothetical protein